MKTQYKETEITNIYLTKHTGSEKGILAYVHTLTHYPTILEAKVFLSKDGELMVFPLSNKSKDGKWYTPARVQDRELSDQWQKSIIEAFKSNVYDD